MKLPTHDIMADKDGEELQFSTDLTTDQLAEYLVEDYGKKTAAPFKKAQVNGASFLKLTRQDLDAISVPKKDITSLLELIETLKQSRHEATEPVSIKFVCKLLTTKDQTA